MSPALPAFALALALTGGRVAAAVPVVVTDIAPVHSLAAAVMEGIGEPAMLLPQSASPHHFALRPSDARLLARAEIVFTIGEPLSPALASVVANVPGKARVVELLKIPDTTLREFHDGEDGHDHHGIDPHAWLDPANARVWLGAMAEALANADPPNAAAYRDNAEAAANRVADAAADAAALLGEARDRRVVVVHDAFGYWQRAFGVTAPLAIADSDAARPGPARLSALRRDIAAEGITCIMAEPQFDPKLVALVAEGSGASVGHWDPLGSDLSPGAGLYPSLLTGLARAYADCAAGAD